jgi:hypothetical protein
MTPTVLGSLTLPLLLALFYLSNARQRRGPMFICVALATLLQIAQSIQQATIHVRFGASALRALTPRALRRRCACSTIRIRKTRGK